MTRLTIADPYLQRLAEIESGGDPNAKNPKSSAGGLFQFIDSTATEYGLSKEDKFKPEKAIPAAKKLTDNNRAALKKAIGRDPTDGELYLAHQQGAGGASKLLANPDELAINILGEDAVLNNGGKADMTARDFSNKWVSKFEGKTTTTTESTSETKIGGKFALETDELTPEEMAELTQLRAEQSDELTPEEMQELEALRAEQDGQPAQPSLTPAQEYAKSNPIERTLGKTGKAVAGGLSSLVDTALLVPKTAALAAGMGLQAVGAEGAGQSLIDLGTTPTMRDMTVGAIDNATGGKLKPTGMIDKVGDFTGEVIAASAPVAQLASKIPVVGESIATVLDPARTVQQTALNALPTPQAPVARPTAEATKKQANAAYSRATELGGTLNAKATDSFLDDVATKVMPQTKAGKALAGSDSPVSKIMQRLESLRGQAINLDEAQEMDEILGEAIDSEFGLKGLSKQGKKLLDIQTSFREMIENASDDMLEGSKEGFEAVKEGRTLWGRAMRMKDIEKIVARAEGAEQPASVIKNGFRTLANNETRMRGYSKAEKAAIKKMAHENLAMEAVRGIASRLFGIGSAVAGGPKGYVIGKGVEMGARGIRDASMRGRADSILDLVSGNAPTAEPLLTPQGGLATLGAAASTGSQLREKPIPQALVK